jgi:hypothetical protein
MKPDKRGRYYMISFVYIWVKTMLPDGGMIPRARREHFNWDVIVFGEVDTGRWESWKEGW